MLNEVLVKIFNTILFNEELYLKKNIKKNITVNGVHILEAVKNLGDNSTMSKIAESLNITVSTLSINIKKLINQEYLTKKQSLIDKRIYLLKLTSKAKKY